ncbi:MAG: TetR/AcrR family transcriptional regulator [Gaiellaceae bacterium]|jgi:AcrR family transcriptional regulator|nr:TetR/AcrR family transcriptional regulator [Gaiellaceae bacterium]
MAARADRRTDRRRQILDAAVKVFARSGFHGARVGDIAEEAGVAYGLVYHYFKSKEELLETIFRDTWTQMLARVREVEGSGVDASEQVRQVTALLLRTWRRDPDLVRVLVREVTRSPHVQQEIEEITEGMKALERIIERGQETGEFRSQIDPRLGAVVIYGALDEILTGWVLGQLPDTDEDIAQAESNVVLLLVEGMRETHIPE